MNQRKQVRFIFILFLLLVMVGCPWQIQKQSSADVYYTALGFWQSTMDNFKIVYSEATEQGKRDMLPAMELLLTTKRDVLNLWKLALVNNDTDGATNKNAEWKKAKNEIILKVVKMYAEDKP